MNKIFHFLKKHVVLSSLFLLVCGIVLIRNGLLVWIAEQFILQKYERTLQIKALDLRFLSPSTFTLETQDLTLSEVQSPALFARIQHLNLTLKIDLFRSHIDVEEAHIIHPFISLWQKGKANNFNDLLKSDSQPSSWQVALNNINLHQLNIIYDAPERFRKKIILSGDIHLNMRNDQLIMIGSGAIQPITPFNIKLRLEKNRLNVAMKVLDLSQINTLFLPTPQTTAATPLDLNQIQQQLKTLPVTGKVEIEKIKLTPEMTINHFAIDLNHK